MSSSQHLLVAIFCLSMTAFSAYSANEGLCDVSICAMFKDEEGVKKTRYSISWRKIKKEKSYIKNCGPYLPPTKPIKLSRENLNIR